MPVGVPVGGEGGGCPLPLHQRRRRNLDGLLTRGVLGERALALGLVAAAVREVRIGPVVLRSASDSGHVLVHLGAHRVGRLEPLVYPLTADGTVSLFGEDACADGASPRPVGVELLSTNQLWLLSAHGFAPFDRHRWLTCWTHKSHKGDIMKIRRLSASLVAAVTIAIMGTVAPQPAQAAGCTVTTPNIHFSSTEPGRFNFKPLVKCTTPEKRQLFLNHRVQYLSGGKWVTTVWTKNTLNQTLSYVRVSLSRTCTTGTFRGQARYMGDSGYYSAWKTSNTFVVTSCAGGGSWRVLPEIEPQ